MTFMGTLWTLVAVVAVVAALAAACIGDLISEEIRHRLDRLPQGLIRLAVRRVPADLRHELYDEWTAGLDEVLRGASSSHYSPCAWDSVRWGSPARRRRYRPSTHLVRERRHRDAAPIPAGPVAGGAIAWPRGYTSTSDTGSGISLAVPNGWTRSRLNNNTFWTAPDRNSFIQIDTTTWPGSSNRRAWDAPLARASRGDGW
jgi:hypothetical protein